MANKSKVDHEQRAGLLWTILTKAATERLPPMKYKELATAIGIHHRPIRYPLGLIQDYCLAAGLPRLTALAVSAMTGVQGHGYLGTPGDEAALDEVYAENWLSHANPFSDLHRNELDQFADEVLADPDKSTDKRYLVLSRGNQQRVFRRAVLEAYDHQCAICGLSFPGALEAAHIAHFQDPRKELRVDPRNGIALCSNHHRLFDSDVLNVTEDYQVKYCDPDREEGPYTSADDALTVVFHGKPIQLPKNPKLYPHRHLLKEREWEV